MAEQCVQTHLVWTEPVGSLPLQFVAASRIPVPLDPKSARVTV